MSSLPDAICNKCCKAATMMCQRCYETYCSPECQIVDWKDHKHQCYQMPSLVPIRRLLRSGPINGHQSESSQSNGAMRRPNHADTDQDHEQRKRYAEGGAPKALTKNEESPQISRSMPPPLLTDKDFVLRPKHPELIAADVSKGAVPKANAAPPSVELVEKAQWRTPFPPPSGVFFDAVVQWLEVENPFIYWVTEAKYNRSLGSLLTEINRSVSTEPPCAIENIHVGALVAAPFDGVYYRAKILKVKPESRMVTVHLIDYGNQEHVPFDTLRMPSPIMRNLSAYAIRIRLPKHYSQALEIESTISIRLLSTNPSSDGVFDVEIKEKSIPLHLPSGFLSDVTDIKLIKIFMGGHQALVQLSIMKDTTAALNTMLNSEHGIKFELDKLALENTFVAARTSEGWRRANLLGHWPENDLYLVYLIDEGVVGICKQLKKLPDSFLEPMRILAISTSAPNAVLCESEMKNVGKLTLRMLSSAKPATTEKLKSLPCALHANERKISDVIATTFTGILNDLGVKCWNEDLIDGGSIHITNVLTHSEIFISSTSSKSYRQIFTSFASKCAMYRHDENIEEDDIVLASLDTNAEYFRAKILAQNSQSSYKVLDIDTGFSSEVSRNSIRKPNLFVRSCPVYLKKVHLIYLDKITHPMVDNKAVYILNQCKDSAAEFIVKFVAKSSDSVELLFKTNTQQSLNKQLLPLVFEERDDAQFLEKSAESLLNDKSPLPLSPPNTPTIIKHTSDEVGAVKIGQKTSSIPDYSTDMSLSLQNLNIEPNVTKTTSKVYTIADVQVVPIQPGDKVSLLVLDTSFMSEGYITVADSCLEIIKQMDDDRKKIAKHAESSASQRNYEPRVNELCLAIFPEDNEWYRAICKKVCPDGTFDLLFVDYGNMCKVTKNGILPITNDLLFPTKANVCYVRNLPPNLSNKQLELFSDTIMNSIIICKVQSQHDKTYTIQIQDIDKYFG